MMLISAVSLPESPKFSENFLQEFLEATPQILPVSAVDDRVKTPLLFLGREVDSTDVLYISCEGIPVIAETKLWRNPEARRVVVAQVIEYGLRVRQWTFADLDRHWRDAGHKESLYEAAKSKAEIDKEEDEWIGLVNENLAQGCMTLLIVGDRIRPRAVELAGVLREQRDFQFRLGFVEIRFYALDDGRILAIPVTLAKTVEVERTVIAVKFKQEQPSVVIEPPSSAVPSRRSILSEDKFCSELEKVSPDGPIHASVARKLLEILGKTDFQVEWVTSGFAIKLPLVGEDDTLLSLGTVARQAHYWFYTGWMRDQLARAWQDRASIERVIEALVASLRRFGARQTPGGNQFNISLASLRDRESAFVDELRRVADVIQETRGSRGESR